MYESYFHFQSRPFPAAPVVANYFPSQSIEGARQNLVRAIERAEGPGIVVGPAGVGKTLLLRVLADHFAQKFPSVVISGTRVTTRKSLLQCILFELNLPYRGLDEGELRLEFIDAIRHNERFQRGILLLIDEAHTLPLRLLDEARLITNIVHDGQPRVRLILAGNHSLEERFTNPKLDSFNQRVAARCYLQPFTRDETHEYLRAEISWAGGDPDRLLGEQTVRAIFQASDGIPRLVNQVCDHALVMAHTAGERRLEATRIQEAWADLQQLPPPWIEHPEDAATTGRAVVEFGELEDGRATPERESQAAGSSRFEGGSDAPPHNAFPDEWPSEVAAMMMDTVVISPPYSDSEVEWLHGGEQAIELEPVRPREPNPFEETFDEELVVIDRSTAKSLDGLRGRPRVSCAEGRELALALLRVLEAAPEPEPAPEPTVLPELENIPCLAPDSTAESAFEFSTLQDAPVIDVPDELETLTSAKDGQIELDFEDDVDCVPLPWARTTRGDDRDIIVVKEDAPPVAANGSAPNEIAAPRRTEYRELFAQLRRVSN